MPVLAVPKKNAHLMYKKCSALHCRPDGASSSSAGPFSSSGPFINLTDTYNDALASITDAGQAFQAALNTAETEPDTSERQGPDPVSER